MKSEDLKYIESLFDSAYIGLASRVSSARLAGVARSYEANMKRTRAFLRLPSTIGHFAVVFMKIEAWTLAEMMDSEQFPNLTREQIIENKTFRDAYDVIALRRLAEENSQNLADPDAAKLIWETGVNNVNQLVNQGGPVIEEAFQSLFASVLVGSWTAFETLVADLWEAALNESPDLGFVALDAEPDPEDDEDEQDKKRKTKYSVPLWMLKKLNYDLRNSLGTLLRKTSKWNFSDRKKAIEAYKKTFKNHLPLIDSIMEAGEVRWLAATRNAIVHNAAIADAEFVRLVKKHPTLGLISENQPIILDGILVKELVNAIVAKGLAIFDFVDSHLASTKEKKK